MGLMTYPTGRPPAPGTVPPFTLTGSVRDLQGVEHLSPIVVAWQEKMSYLKYEEAWRNLKAAATHP